MIHRKHALLIGLLFSTLLAGCNMPTPAPSCTAADLVAPALSSPAMWAVVDSLSPTLSWNSSDPSLPYPYDICVPHGYHVTLHMGASSTFDMGGDTYGPGMREWTPASPLTPGSEYHWGVNAYRSGADGPYAGNRVFFTGPVCATSALAAPTLHDPFNGEMVNTLMPMLIWDYPDPCVPQGYRIDLSTDSTFTDTSLSGGTGNPSTRWFPGEDLTDCSTYYWRVAPINGTTLGPFSITRNFMVNVSGACLYPLPEVLIPIEPLVTVPPFLPEFTLDRNANCRIGPSQLFEIYTSFFAGDKLPIEGRNEDASWLFAHTPDDGFCWVSIVTGKFNGDLDTLQVIDAPPPPEPTEEGQQQPRYDSCQDYTSQALCKEDPGRIGGCYWSPNNVCDQLK
jgi:hypothetical protein